MSFSKIRKRDGRIVDFEETKITNAIYKAGRATREFGKQTAAKLARRVAKRTEQVLKKDIPTVEELQDIVEDVLLESSYRKTAKAYIVYRDQHASLRRIAAKNTIDLFDEYLAQITWQIKENSNMAFSLQGLNNFVASEMTKDYWLYKIYPPAIREAHTKGDYHLHDLNLLGAYCVGWDLTDLLRRGFAGAKGKVESKPAKHLDSILSQAVNFFYTLQGESAGAQAFSNFDTLLAPFIRADKLDYKETKQIMQRFIYNMAVPTRVGFQTPFTNITMDLEAPSHLKNSPVIIGGKLQKETYGQFQKEQDMFNRAFAEIMMEGDAKGRVFTFPIPTYNIDKDFDWNNPRLEPIWRMTAKYGVPYFANFVNSDMKPEDARSMCCRLRISNEDLRKRGGGLFGANPLTGAIGVVTINMPRIGYLSESKPAFLMRLSRLMDLAKDSLEIKRKMLERLTDFGLYPYSKFYLSELKEKTGNYWTNHFSTIGLIGTNEALLNFTGKDIGTKEGHAFAGEVLDFMRQRLMQYQEETGNPYNLEATPAEGTSYRLAKMDKEEYPDIITANEKEVQKGAEPFYTNSTHLPVNYTDDIFEVLDLQDDLQTKYTGGTVIHIFLGEEIKDTATVKRLVRRVSQNYHLPYFSLTPTFSVCPNHGYLKGKQEICPQCGEETEVYSRIVGYLRPVEQWNKGKREEFKLRTAFNLKPRPRQMEMIK